MDNLGRREVLIGSGLILALAGCDETLPQAQDNNLEGMSALSGPGVNHGIDPTGYHPGGTQQSPTPFNPSHIGVLHLELATVGNLLKIIATRAHFPRDSNAANNDLAGNMSLIKKALDHLNNDNEPPVDDMVKYPGIKKASFRQPTHVIIYVKNNGIDYSRNCIWFGQKLHNNTTPAAENQSFFEAQPHDASAMGYAITNGSQKFIYCKNYFHYKKPDGTFIQIEGFDLTYALNINAFLYSNDGLDIPIIIDPDTGNMGTGPGGGGPLI